jgi:hypothetical protein
VGHGLSLLRLAAADAAAEQAHERLGIALRQWLPRAPAAGALPAGHGGAEKEEGAEGAEEAEGGTQQAVLDADCVAAARALHGEFGSEQAALRRMRRVLLLELSEESEGEGEGCQEGAPGEGLPGSAHAAAHAGPAAASSASCASATAAQQRKREAALLLLRLAPLRPAAATHALGRLRELGLSAHPLAAAAVAALDAVLRRVAPLGGAGSAEAQYRSHRSRSAAARAAASAARVERDSRAAGGSRPAARSGGAQQAQSILLEHGGREAEDGTGGGQRGKFCGWVRVCTYAVVSEADAVAAQVRGTLTTL